MNNSRNPILVELERLQSAGSTVQTMRLRDEGSVLSVVFRLADGTRSTMEVTNDREQFAIWWKEAYGRHLGQASLATDVRRIWRED